MQDIRIEGRQVEILPEWRAKIEAELARLQQHYHDPILHARVEIIGTSHHRLGAFEVHLVVNVPGDTITLVRQGDMVMPLVVEAFDALDRRLRVSIPKWSNNRSKPMWRSPSMGG